METITEGTDFYRRWDFVSQPVIDYNAEKKYFFDAAEGRRTFSPQPKMQRANDFDLFDKSDLRELMRTATSEHNTHKKNSARESEIFTF